MSVENGHAEDDARDARALVLAKAHHAAMGQAMRDALGGHFIVGSWQNMDPARRQACVAVMRKLLDDGVIT